MENKRLKTVADLKRLPIGTRLRLVHCLLGPVNKLRVLAKVDTVSLMFTGDGIPPGELSYLSIPRRAAFEPTDNGFLILEGVEPAIEYVFEPDAEPLKS